MSLWKTDELRHIKEAMKGIEENFEDIISPNANFRNSLKDRIEIYSSDRTSVWKNMAPI